MAPRKTKGRKAGSKSVSGSTRAGTIFPTGRCRSYLKNGRYAERIGGSAGVFMAGVLEYITAELCELAGAVCLEHKKKQIMPKHINLGVKNDEELAKLMNMTTISQGGQPVFLHEALVMGKKGKKGGASQ
jgi:histone H2A